MPLPLIPLVGAAALAGAGAVGVFFSAKAASTATDGFEVVTDTTSDLAKEIGEAGKIGIWIGGGIGLLWLSRKAGLWK
jgi:hypothetical protein